MPSSEGCFRGCAGQIPLQGLQFALLGLSEHIGTTEEIIEAAHQAFTMDQAEQLVQLGGPESQCAGTR